MHATYWYRLLCGLICWCLPGLPVALAQRAWLVAVPLEETAKVRNVLDAWAKQYQGRWQDTVLHFPAGADVALLTKALTDQLHEQAFYLASLDSLHQSDSLVVYRLYVGPAFEWVQLRSGPELGKKSLDAAGVRLSTVQNKPLAYGELVALQNRVLAYAENEGYPFARVWIDSAEIQPDGGVSAVLRLQRNAPMYFGNITVLGDVRLPKGFLPQYLGIRAGTPYSKTRVDAAAERLRGLLFLETAGSPIARFEGSKVDLRMPLRKKRAGRFDFIIGLLPQPNDPAGRLLLTGSLSAAFQNALGWGERLSLEFERLRPETQKLNVEAAVPYVLGTPFGADGRLNIFRRDSSWVDAQGKIGVQYLFAVGNSVGFFWDNRSLFLQKIDTQTVKQTRQLPPNLDLRQNGFGLEANWQALDYRFNPRRGWAASAQGAAGFSTLRRNSQIENLSDPNDPTFDFGTLYDQVPEKTTRYRLSGTLEYYFPLFKRSTFKTAVRAQGLFSSTPVYNNEQFRLGGNKLLRGFNEETLFATRYAVGTAEYRLLIGANSYIAAFADYAYVENITDRIRLFQRPLGLGAGIVFESQAGLFGISGAVGRLDNGDPFDLRSVKVHLGYVNLF